MGKTYRGRHLHKQSTKYTDYAPVRGGYKVETNDNYWWDRKSQELYLQGYDLPPNPNEGNKPIWNLISLAEKHPEEVKRLYWQCEWEGLGKYSGKHKPLSEEACKLITMACFGRGICKEGRGMYAELYKKYHPIDSIKYRGLKKR